LVTSDYSDNLREVGAARNAGSKNAFPNDVCAATGKSCALSAMMQNPGHRELEGRKQA
jgi:hypothetical protein